MASVTGALQTLGLSADKNRTLWVLTQVRQLSMQAKRVVSREELLDFYHRASETSLPIYAPMEVGYDCA
jgi:hypothetical protein